LGPGKAGSQSTLLVSDKADLPERNVWWVATDTESDAGTQVKPYLLPFQVRENFLRMQPDDEEWNRSIDSKTVIEYKLDGEHLSNQTVSTPSSFVSYSVVFLVLNRCKE
jgi:hypothetical protein